LDATGWLLSACDRLLPIAETSAATQHAAAAPKRKRRRALSATPLPLIFLSIPMIFSLRKISSFSAIPSIISRYKIASSVLCRLQGSSASGIVSSGFKGS
jgi:hypothetical protein